MPLRPNLVPNSIAAGGRGGRGVRVVSAQTQAQKRVTHTISKPESSQSLSTSPAQRQPLRGLSPHPPPLSPTRGEGSKTVRTSTELPGKIAQIARAQPRASPPRPLAAILFGTRFDSGGSSFSLDLARYLRSRYMFLTYCQFCSEMRNGRQERSD